MERHSVSYWILVHHLSQRDERRQHLHLVHHPPGHLGQHVEVLGEFVRSTSILPCEITKLIVL